MKNFLRYLESIAYFFLALILLQSCIIYKTQPTSIEEALQYNDRRIKVVTNDVIYKLKWVEIIDENILSITNTKRIAIDKNKIRAIRAFDQKPMYISLDSSFNHIGTVQVKADFNYKFMRIYDHGDHICGVRYSRDTTIILIPIDSIEEIKMQNKGLSRIGNAFIGVGIVFTAIIIWLASSFENES